jgi:hypothetical protein
MHSNARIEVCAMRTGRVPLSALVCAALFAAGCGRIPTTIHTEGVVVKVLIPALSASEGTIRQTPEGLKHINSWRGGEVEFTIRDKKFLSVNGRDYGTVEAKDEVVIDGPTAAVTVNGVEREPGPEQPEADAADRPKS